LGIVESNNLNLRRDIDNKATRRKRILELLFSISEDHWLNKIRKQEL